MDERYIVDTPENIDFAYDIGGIGSRFLAAIIDTLLIGMAELVVFFVLGLLASRLNIGNESTTAAVSIVAAIGGFIAFVILCGYYIVFDLVWNGQSPGKRVIGLRVVREGGRPITFISSAIRNFIRIIDFLPAFYGIGVVVMFIDRRARRLGDLAGGTLVVKERRNVTLESLVSDIPSLTAPLRSDETAPQLTLPNLQLLNDRDYGLVQEFLRRRTQLKLDARVKLGAQLASGLQARLGLPQGGDAEHFLQQVATEYQLLRHQTRIGELRVTSES